MANPFEPAWRRFWAWSVGSLLGCAIVGAWWHPFLLFNAWIAVVLLTYALTPEPTPQTTDLPVT